MAAAVNAKALKGAGIKYMPKQTEIEAMRIATYAPMENESGVFPREIIHQVQDAIAPCDYVFVKTEDRMKEAFDIVKQAEQMLPDMKARDCQELCKSVDARSMVVGAEMFYRASMMRTESRGFHLREDYLDMDDTNWLKWIIIQNVDGEMVLRTEDISLGDYDCQPDKGARMA
jgi:succinate dehydrogenase/fumarate reductase flavoprotein subunit